MRVSLFGVAMSLFLSLGACTSEPVGQWEATDKVEVFKNNDHPLEVAFVIDKGEVCALSADWFVRKDLGYKQVICPKGRGWITDDRHFKKLTG